MSPILDNAQIPLSSSQDTDFWAHVGVTSTYTLRHLGLLREKIEQIFSGVNWKNEQELSYRLQKVIFKSHLDTEIRRRISRKVDMVLRKFPKISETTHMDMQKQILQITENIPELLQNPLPDRAIVLPWENMMPVHERIHATIFQNTSSFDASEEQLIQINQEADYWFLLLLEILEVKSLRMRDVYLYRFCEILIATGLVTHELIPDVMHIRVLKMLLDTDKIKMYYLLTPEERELLWLEQTSNTLSIDSHFVWPRLTEKIKTVHLYDWGDVSGDFAWSVDVLVKKFEKLKREIYS